MHAQILPARNLWSFPAVVKMALPVMFFSTASLLVLTPRSVAQASSFLAQNVGAASPTTLVAVPIIHAGVLSAVRVGGQGNAGVDFAAAGTGSCASGMFYTPGQICTVGVTFAPNYPGLRSGAVVLAAPDGTVLGTAFVSGLGVGGIGTFVPGMMLTKAGGTNWLYAGDGVPALNAPIYLPFGIAVDSVGNVYIADYGNNRIRKVTASSGLISTIAGTGIIGATGDGGAAVLATMTEPTSVALDGAGNVFFCDSGNDAVRRIDGSTGLVSTVAGTLGKQGYSGDGKLATAATLNGPNGIALDLAGNLFIADSSNNAIRRVSYATGIISTVAGTGTAGFSGDGGQATSASLNAPWSMTPIASGGFYVADQGNNRLRAVDVHGVITTLVGTGVGDEAGDGGPASLADLNSPANVVVDVAGNIYIADSGNNRVRKISVSTGRIATVAGPGASNITGDYGPATQAVLDGPYTLALDGLGNLYIGDVFHNRVRQIDSGTALLLEDPMRLGRVSAPQPQSLENDGNATLNLVSIAPATQSAIDPASTTCLGGLALLPLGTCTIGAESAPTQLGTPVFGTISIVSDAVNSPGTLILEGNVLNQDPSRVALSASTNLAPAGTSILFIVTITSGGDVPTGDITLLDGGNPVATVTLGPAGVATISLASLAGGQHIMTASYPGDSNNTAGESSPLVVVIQYVTAPTNTTVAASANPVLAGSPLTLTANVALVSAGTGVGTISGPVTFTDAGTILGAAAVANGIATFKTSILSATQHTIVANYGGSTSFGSSASAPLSITVQPAISKTLLSSSANPSVGGALLTLSVAITGNGPNPTGTVTFLDRANVLGSATIGTTGIATLTLATLSVGSHNLSATYAGDAENNGSASAPLVQTVTLAKTSAVLISSLNPAPQGGTVVLTATITGNGGTPGGTIQFFDGPVSVGNAPLDRTGIATLTTSTLAIGTHPITAAYAGDGLDAPSTSAVLTETLQSATVSMTLTSGLSPSPFAANVVFSVRVQGTGTQPVGVVTLVNGSAALGMQTLDATGLATFICAGLPIGTNTLTAQYAGDTYHSATSAKLTQTVLQVTTAVLAASTGNAVAGTPVTWTAAVAGSSGLPLTGTLQFKDGSTTLATLPLSPAGNATFSSPALAVGTHTMSAVYSGDTQNEPATSSAVPEQVQIAVTSVALGSSANPSFAGTNLILTATVTGNGAIPGGLVTFHDGSASLGSAPVSASGAASLTTNTLAPGLHSVTASYGGDVNDSPATSAALAQDIGQQTTVTIASSANPSMFQNAITLSIAVTGGVPANPATGTVTLTDGRLVIGTATLNASATATFNLASPSLGQHALAASYMGDSRYSPASSQVFTQSVILRPTAIDLKLSASQISAGQPITLFASVQGAGPYIPSGTVNFVNGAEVLGSATLDASGVAAVTFNPPQGSDQVTAQYLGDTLFATSSSAPIALLVGPPIAFDIAVTPAAISMQSGAHTTLNISIGVAAGFSDTLQMGCAGLPASATCTFSQAQVKVSNATGQTISVVVDTGNPLGAGASAKLETAPAGTALACILPGGLLLGLLLVRGRRKLTALTAWIALAVLSAGLVGCANSLHVNDTPAGAYTFQIVGTGADSGVTQSAAIAMTVTQ